VVLVAGDTGCGKSTQVPQYLIAAGFANVACTQPRRISTMSLCHRVSSETFNEFGTQVAYQIRFESNRTEKTKILFLTEGLLLRQLAGDPTLDQYSVIIIDEVHERHLTGDFLLGVLRSVLAQRPSLRLVLMSATINTQMFADYFGAFIIKVPGRLYPIGLEYIPVEFDADGQQLNPEPETGAKPKLMNAKPYLQLLKRIDETYPRNERGDLLIFLSGQATNFHFTIHLHSTSSCRWIILMLHSTLPTEEQDKVFDLPPEGVRKCVLSTNIAETSVTIDGIRFVADSGKRHPGTTDGASHRRHREYWISKASANQRKGRAGRTGPGQCFRLYSQEQFNAFNDFAIPEIHRVPLESTALQIKVSTVS
ncbi:P-loop containing nucleoside triphosphate hydrolase protein, partial [Baffinella frigidus]